MAHAPPAQPAPPPALRGGGGGGRFPDGDGLMGPLVGAALGVAMGVLSGLGVGGGKLVVPVLVLFLGFTQQTAQGAVLLAFLPLAALAAFQHWRQGTFDGAVARRVFPTAVVGAALGALLAQRVDPSGLRTAYGLFLIAMGLYQWVVPGGEARAEAKP
ncbi:MAG: hypothetical protein CW349_09175 [Firmicutes bacterium]|nr:hypothetical protein [Bacillota bacterium]MBO2519850.1 hypothetical protein [Bacillota bacterium]